MPTVPATTSLSATAADILNAIRNNASMDYRNYVPAAANDIESIRTIGNVIMDYPGIQNEFLNALVNRIARVMITSKSYRNPWAIFKKGLLEFGETVEEIFVNIAKPFEFDPEVAETELYKREMPDVKAAFHTLNYQKFYKTTVTREQLRQAFLSVNGLLDLVGKITESLYTGMEYDEFLVMKYLLARRILNGHFYPETVPAVSAANMKEITSSIKGISDAITFLSPKYNLAGVYTHSDKERQYLIVNTAFNSKMDVEVLASAFNMDKAEFAGHRILVDGFGDLNSERLAILFRDDANYTAITSAEMQALNAIPAILVDQDFFMIFDNLLLMKSRENEQGLYQNYFLHTWKTFSVSPFANAIAFVPGTPSVTSVTVSPSTATVTAGNTVSLGVTVATQNFAPQSVTWTISPTTGASVSASGVVTINEDTTESSYTVTATSTFDTTKTGTATITVS